MKNKTKLNTVTEVLRKYREKRNELSLGHEIGDSSDGGCAVK